MRNLGFVFVAVLGVGLGACTSGEVVDTIESFEPSTTITSTTQPTTTVAITAASTTSVSSTLTTSTLPSPPADLVSYVLASTESGPSETGWQPGVSAAADGSVVVFYIEGDPEAELRTGSLMAIRCVGEGCDPPVSVSDGVSVWHEMSVVTSGKGLPVIMLQDRVLICNDTMCDAYDEFSIGEFTFQGIGVSLNGDLVLGYGRGKSDGGWDLIAATCDPGDCSGTLNERVFFTANGFGGPWAVGASPEGHPVVAFLTGDPWQLQVAVCDGSGCSVTLIAAEANRPSLVVGEDGNPIIFFNQGSSVIVADCHDRNCGQTIQTEVGRGTGSSEIAVAAIPEGTVVASWIEGEQLVVAICSASGCSTAAVDNQGLPPSGYVSIDATKDGRLVVTHSETKYFQGETGLSQLVLTR